MKRLSEYRAKSHKSFDVKDKKLIDLLRINSRAPISELAKKLSLNRDTINYRMKRLENAGIITKYYAEIDRSVFGYSVCHVFMLLNETNRRKQEKLLRELIKHPNTESVIEYNDKWDIKWTLVVRHVEELDAILMKLSTKYTGVIIEKDTLLIVRWSRAALEEANGTTILDEKDISILKSLAINARASAVQIGQEIQLSPDAVIKRIRILCKNKIIRRFTINLDAKAMDLQWYTVVIQMRHFDEKHQATLIEYVTNHQNVVRCYKTIGTYDIILRVVINDISEFHKTFKELKTMFSAIIRNYDTYVGYTERYITPFPRIIWSKEELKEKKNDSREKRIVKRNV